MFWLLLCIVNIPLLYHEIRIFNKSQISNADANGLSAAAYQCFCSVMFFALVVVQVLAHLVSAGKPKGSQWDEVKAGTRNSPEPYLGFINRVFFMWFGRLIWKGYHKTLEPEDLWDIIPENTSKAMMPLFVEQWRLNVEKGERDKCADKHETNMKPTKVRLGQN